MRDIQQTPAPLKNRNPTGDAAELPKPVGRDASIPAHRSDLAPAFPANTLGPREQEVLRCLAQGQSRRKIASSLFISPATVHTHLKNIYVKLDAHNSIEAINEARRRLLLD